MALAGEGGTKKGGYWKNYFWAWTSKHIFFPFIKTNYQEISQFFSKIGINPKNFWIGNLSSGSLENCQMLKFSAKKTNDESQGDRDDFVSILNYLF